MATIRDVARLAEVSISTVSRVINDSATVDTAKRERVLQAIQELGYETNMMAKALKHGRTNTIAFFIPDLKNMIYPSLAVIVEDEAKKYGYFVIFCNTQESQHKELEYIRKLKGRVVDGFLFSTALGGEESKGILALKQEGVPAICLMRETGDTSDSVVSDNELGGYLGTKYLLDRGMRRIAVICGRKNLPLYVQRLAGYCTALEEYGIDYDPDLCLDGVYDGRENGNYCLMQYCEQGREMPEAIFALSDPLAFDTMIALQRLGYSVPSEVSVMGFDNVPFAMNYNLTTIEQNLEAMARLATRQLIQIIEKKAVASQPQYKFAVSIVERSTVANPKHSEI